MEGPKAENSEDDGAAAPVKRVLRSRIIEVDNNSEGSIITNGVESDACSKDISAYDAVCPVPIKGSFSEIKNHSTPTKRSLRNRTANLPVSASDKDSVEDVTVKETDMKGSSPEDKKKTNVAEEFESQPSSPISQCGSEASNVSVRVLRNSKCVVIPLEYDKKEVADHGGNNENGKSKKVVLSSVCEENEDNNDVDKNELNEKKDDCENKETVVNNSSFDESKLDENDKITETLHTSSVSTSSVNILKNPTDGGEENEKPSRTSEKAAPDCSSGDDGKHSESIVENNKVDNGNKEVLSVDNVTAVEGTEVGCNSSVMDGLQAEVVTSSSSQENKRIENGSLEPEKEKSNDKHQSLEDDIEDKGSSSDTTEEFQNEESLKNVTERKPIDNKELGLKITKSLQNEEIFKNITNQKLITNEMELRGTESHKHQNEEISHDISVSNSAEDENSLLPNDGCSSKTVESVEVSHNYETPSSVVAEVNTEEAEVSSVEVCAVSVNDELVKSDLEADESVTIVEVTDSYNDISVPKPIQEELEGNTEVKEQQVIKTGASIVENIVQNAECTKENEITEQLDKNVINLSNSSDENRSVANNASSDSLLHKKNKSKINISNVLNLLGVNKSGNKIETIPDDLLDSDSGSEGVPSSCVQKSKMKKQVIIESDPVQYHGIGKDALLEIMKEAVAGAVIGLKQELCSVKEQLTNVTSLLNEIKRGEKRKSETSIEDIISDDTSGNGQEDYVKVSLSSSTSASPKKNSPSPVKGSKTKADLIKEILEDVSDHLQSPVKKKKKIKLFESQENIGKNRKKRKLNNEEPKLHKELNCNNLGNEMFVDVNKKKKKLKLLQEDYQLFSTGKVLNSKKIGEIYPAQEEVLIDMNLTKTSSCGTLPRKKKKIKKGQDLSNILSKKIPFSNSCENDTDLKVDEQITNEISINKIKKYKNKTKFEVIPDLIEVKSDINLLEGLPCKKKKKKKKKLCVAPDATLVLDSNIENYKKNHNSENVLLSSEVNETGQKKIKKKKKDKMNTSNFGSMKFLSSEDKKKVEAENDQISVFHSRLKKSATDNRFSTNGSSPSQLKKLKKKRRKQKMLCDDIVSSSAASPNNKFNKEKGYGNVTFSDTGNVDEDKLLKKMKYWKSNNKNQSYRVTPYMGNKNKKFKFDNN